MRLLETVLGLVAVLLLSVLAGPLSLEEIFLRCKGVGRSDLEKCLVRLINDMQPFFTTGMQELDLEPKDAFPVGTLMIDQESGNSYLRARFYDVLCKGLHEMTLTDLQIDYPGRRVLFSFDAPEFVAVGHYEMDAQLLLVPLKGKGTFWLRLGDFKCTGATNFKLTKTDGDLRIVPYGTQLEFNYTTISNRLNNLFDGNPILKEGADAFVQANGEIIVEEIKPELKDKLVTVGEDIITRVFRRVSFKNLAGREFLEEAFKLRDI